MLAKLTGARLHVAHVSSAGAVELIRRARDEGVDVTAEVTPHHLRLTDEATSGYDTNTKMAPPLRGVRDTEACRAGLADGTLDVYATDHAPHHYDEKEQAERDDRKWNGHEDYDGPDDRVHAAQHQSCKK